MEMAFPLHMNATCGPVHRTEMAGVEAASSATPLVLFQDALRELDLGDQAPGRRHARVITECTPPFRIVHVNKAWEELCGFSAEDVIGRTFGELMQGPGTSARTLKELGAATAAGSPTTQLLLNYKKGGEAFINLLQVKPVHSGQTGKVTNFLGQLEDVGILDAGRIRVRLGHLGWKGRAWCKPSLDLASATADCGHARVITEASAPFRILHVNRSWSLMCGFSPEEARGETLSIIQGKGRASPTQHTQTSCVSGSLARLTNALAQGQHTTALLLNYRKSGEPFLNFLQVSPILDDFGRITHFLGQLEDLSAKTDVSLWQSMDMLSIGAPSQRTAHPELADGGLSATDRWRLVRPDTTNSMPCRACTATTTAEVSARNSPCEVLVSLETPVTVLNASDVFLNLFELTPWTCFGQSLMILAGPGTDLDRIMRMVDEARAGKDSDTSVVLYSTAGLGGYYRVHAQPFHNGIEAVGCLLSVVSENAMSSAAAIADDASAKVVIDAGTCRTVYASHAFASVYGIHCSAFVGRTLNLIHGPGTDLGLWRRSIATAVRGARVRSQMVTVTAGAREINTDLEFVPMLNDYGYVSLVLIRTLSATPLKSACEAKMVCVAEPVMAVGPCDSNTTRQPHANLPVHSDVNRAVEMSDPSQPQDSVGTATAVLSMASMQNQVPVHRAPANEQGRGHRAVSIVVPRGNHCHKAQPVCITMQLWEQMRHLPLVKAADTLGISSTAMKKACRRLGVPRWSYGRDNRHVHVDSSYVRRVQRKHAASLRKQSDKEQRTATDQRLLVDEATSDAESSRCASAGSTILASSDELPWTPEEDGLPCADYALVDKGFNAADLFVGESEDLGGLLLDTLENDCLLEPDTEP